MDKIKEKIEELKENGSEIKTEVREKTLGYILAALGLVAGLSWNETIKAVIEYFFPLAKDTISAKILYSVFVTIVVVVLSIYLTKLFKKNEEKNGE